MASGLVSPLVQELLSQIKNKIDEINRVKSDSMQLDIKRLVAQLDDELVKSRDAHLDSTTRERIEVMRDLTRDMEDYLEGFQDPRMRKKGSIFQVFIPQASLIPNYVEAAKELKKLNERLQGEYERQKRHGAYDKTLPPSTKGPERHILIHRPVGISLAKSNLLMLLEEGPNELRVICILGFGGSGKANLAHAVYNTTTTAQGGNKGFSLRAFVDRADYDDVSGLLRKIIEQFSEADEVTHRQSDESHLRQCIINHLDVNRYLVVLLDMDKKMWEKIKDIFQGVPGRKRSRIILTTSMLDMANHCRDYGDGGYVYLMRTIGNKGSKEISRLNDDDGSKTLLKKCDGLPLALASVNNHFTSEGGLTLENCAQLCDGLGSFLHDARRDRRRDFSTLRGVLMDNYVGLSGHSVRSCLLYLGIFPNDGRPINRNKVTRRWVAEGYAPINNGARRSEQDVAEDSFKELTERNIIQPIGIRNSTRVLKACRAVSILHEFVLHKSMSDDFIMTIDGPPDDQTEASTSGKKKKKQQQQQKKNRKVRHIFVNGGTNVLTNSGEIHVSSVRSLTVSGQGGANCKFSKYKLMRVLDLEESTDGANEIQVKDICKLWNLRYLSLGPNITELPPYIAQLQLLESLHLSKDHVTILPIQVIIGMPHLIHLIGKFKIVQQNARDGNELADKSNLQILAGFVADGHQDCFLLHMHQMKKLTKVKIWCEANNTESTKNILDFQLPQAIHDYIVKKNGGSSGRSLSINFQGLPGGWSRALRALNKMNSSVATRCYLLSSLKLHDEDLSLLPQFETPSSSAVTSSPGLHDFLLDLTKLCLSLTTLQQNLLSSLSGMHYLVHLKLIASQITGQRLDINGNELQRLKSLCFEVTGVNAIIPSINFHHGALPELISLQLLCKNLAGPSGIEHLRKLQEIELHDGVNDPSRQEWEANAWNHPNRPNVLPLLSVDDPENQDDAATSEESAHDGVAPKNSVKSLASKLKSMLPFTTNQQLPPTSVV